MVHSLPPALDPLVETGLALVGIEGFHDTIQVVTDLLSGAVSQPSI